MSGINRSADRERLLRVIAAANIDSAEKLRDADYASYDTATAAVVQKLNRISVLRDERDDARKDAAALRVTCATLRLHIDTQRGVVLRAAEAYMHALAGALRDQVATCEDEVLEDYANTIDRVAHGLRLFTSMDAAKDAGRMLAADIAKEIPRER